MSITRIAVAGSTGYSGQEFLKLLSRHSQFRLAAKIGREENVESLGGKVDLAVLCTPNEISLEMAPKLLAQGIHVIDVAGAFRLKRHAYPEWYGFEHASKEWLARAEYALVPWRKLAPAREGEARLIANPGCFPTATLMALLPLLKSGFVDPARLVIDAKSGTTGAGRKAEVRLLFSELEGEFQPYKVGRHQHWPEIVEATAQFADLEINPVFVTELLPVSRGISVAIFGEWSKRPAGGAADLLKVFEEAYAGEPDVSVGADPALLSMKSVVNTNRVHIHVAEAYGRPVVFSVIDNLVRGAAGQAMLNANALAGISLRDGLT